ncbi:Transcription factor GRAS domain-containing protein [Dioscorea alata]|uniref:Transcription factor GRAS domain-containing protein n=1 Tax=Dioscorea alata TaxID=55571 RepID=A0ACB7WT29_DIOAL|nr:Transcription factor GRAS domain-containing protein [Dioscorea alata]
MSRGTVTTSLEVIFKHHTITTLEETSPSSWTMLLSNSQIPPRAAATLDSFTIEPLSPHVDHRPRKVLQRDNSIDVTTSTTNNNNNKRLDQNAEDKGLRMITLLLECAVAISVDNLTDANRMLLELTHMASPYSPSCAERVVAYFTKAMASRVMNSWLRTCCPIVPHKSILTAFQTFNTVSPYIKFAHFTANQAILEAFHQKDIVHIVDLDIMHGLQWPALFHILATRPEGPPLVRLTGFGSSMEALEETGRQLSTFAKRLGMSLEFHPVAKRSGDIDPWMVQARRGETMAVHWLQHSLYDATGPDLQTMRLIQLLSPRVITLVEQEMLSCGSFLDRFVGSLHYYSTLFDSLGASLACDDPGRQRVEHGLLGREINNVMAIGGPARSGEDKFVSWRMELAQRGFLPVPMSSNAMAQAQLILNMFPPSLGHMILQGDDGTLRLGWKETGLYTASAWTVPRLLLH